MRNLVAYRQSLTLATKKWNMPHRKDGENWVPIKREHIMNVCDGVLRGAILKMKRKLGKMRHPNSNPVWDCTMSSKEKGGYRIYYLICKKIIQERK